MNKTAVKKFAIEARNKLRASVIVKAGMLGITEEECSSPITKGTDFEIYKTAAGTEVTLNRSQCEQRRKLVEQIDARGFDIVVEEVAYTWFNRICAIRFMEVNDYLPSRIRVLSSEKVGKNEPDIVTQAPDVDLDFTDKEREFILDAKMNNKSDELFRMLFIKQCNKLSEILPELFEATEDYTEMLLNISYTNEDDIVRMLVDEDGIPEENFNVSAKDDEGNVTGQVEIIGWLYQYYNTELKEDTFAKLKKNIKISKERIPAATQLFTPDWIVRYMVENSVGRLWIEHLRANGSSVNEKQVAESFGWKYYLPEAEQEDDVNIKLAEIRTTYKDLRPEDITCIDPCMGSGHILIAMFDVLMDIYKSAGYSERDAAFLIVENNIHGLDIDKRAYQLAYFALMMKGRGCNRRFFSGRQSENGERVTVQPQIYVIEESNDVNRAQLKYWGADLNEIEKNDALNQMNGVLDELRDATEYGSVLNVGFYNWDLLRRFASKESSEGQLSFDTLWINETKIKLEKLIKIGNTIAQKYKVVVTNPPYMSMSNGSTKLNKYIKDNYTDNKSDLFGVFMERCLNYTVMNGFVSMVTQHSWMFLSSFSKLREKIIKNCIINMAHLGTRAFEEIGGEVVQTTSFVIRQKFVEKYKGSYIRLTDYSTSAEKEKNLLLQKNRFDISQGVFRELPDNVIAYWVTDGVLAAFKNGQQLGDYASPKQGLATTDNNRFVRLWYEVDFSKIGFGMTSMQANDSGLKWFPLNKGGSYRKWYGNNECIVNYQFDGKEIKENVLKKYSYLKTPDFVVKNQTMYFRENGTWSAISSGDLSVRYSPQGFVISNAGMAIFHDSNLLYLIAFMNSNVVSKSLIKIINQTLNFNAGDIEQLPLIIDKERVEEIEMLAKENIAISKEDWDCFENSWDFKKHPLI